MKNLIINLAFTALFIVGLSLTIWGLTKGSAWAMFIGGGALGFWHSILLDYIRSMKNG